MPWETVREAEGNNSHESPCECEPGFRRFPRAAEVLVEVPGGGISTVFKNLTLAQERVQILKSQTNARVTRTARFLELWPWELDFRGDWIHGAVSFPTSSHSSFSFFLLKGSESPSD